MLLVSLPNTHPSPMPVHPLPHVLRSGDSYLPSPVWGNYSLGTRVACSPYQPIPGPGTRGTESHRNGPRDSYPGSFGITKTGDGKFLFNLRPGPEFVDVFVNTDLKDGSVYSRGVGGLYRVLVTQYVVTTHTHTPTYIGSGNWLLTLYEG